MKSRHFALAAVLRPPAAMTDQACQTSLPYGHITDRILNCFFRASGELGHGFSEQVLRRGMLVLLQEAGMQVLDEYPLEVHFHGRIIGRFVADLIVERRVLVEVKAHKSIEPYAQAQLINYLKVAGGGVGLLLNFGPKPEFKRMVIGDLANSLPHLSA